MNPSEHILRTLASKLEGPAHLRLLGGAALVLGYGLGRSTEDVDLLLEDGELQVLIEEANIGAALEATNLELEPSGLYLSHIWGPEQQILTPEWREGCRRLDRDWGRAYLTVSVLGPLDLILSKLCRADDGDLDDIRHILAVERLQRATVEDALARALVPEDFRAVFPEHVRRVLALFDGG